MLKAHYPLVIVGAIALLALSAFAVWGIPYFFWPVHIAGGPATFGSQSARARVIRIMEEGQIELNGRNQLYQVMRVDILEGDYKGIPFDVDYGKRTLRSDNFRFAPSDEIYVLLSQTPDHVIRAYKEDGASYSSLTWSPDSRHLFYSRYSLEPSAASGSNPGHFDVYTADTETGESRLLAAGGDLPALLP